MESVHNTSPSKSSERPSDFDGETFNSPSAHGQHTSNGVEGMMPEPGHRHMRGNRAGAQTGGKPRQDKRQRGKKWDDGIKTMLLEIKLMHSQCLLNQPPPVRSWAYCASVISGRNWKSCKQQWNTLLKYYKAIRDHELKTTAGSYWEMTECQKDDVNTERRRDLSQVLPPQFKREWCEMIDLIYQNLDAAKKIPSRKQIFQKCSTRKAFLEKSSSTAPLASTITDSDNSPEGPLDATRSQPSSSQEIQESMDPPLPLVSDQDHHRAKDDVLQGESHDDLISMKAPYVNIAIGEALKPHWDSVLRSQEGAEPRC